MEKAFDFGILVGRFQTLHTGHCQMIRKAMDLCDRVAVFVGSSQEKGTEKNPFSYETRKDMLRAVFNNGIEIYPLPDIGVGNNSKWGEYVLSQVLIHTGYLPDLLISGKESRRADWFGCAEGQNISELYVPKSIDISASQMREYLINGEKENWIKYVVPELYGFYEMLRHEAMLSTGNTETKSM